MDVSNHNDTIRIKELVGPLLAKYGWLVWEHWCIKMLSFYLFVSIVTAKSMETFVTLYPVSSLTKAEIKERFSLLIVITIFFHPGACSITNMCVRFHLLWRVHLILQKQHQRETLSSCLWLVQMINSGR